MTADALSAALDYAAHGWPVFALGPRKAPLGLCAACKDPANVCPGGDACACEVDTCHSFYKATTDPDRLREWWGRRRYPGIGLRCGAPSGVVALDVDGQAGVDSLAAHDSRVGGLPGKVLQRSGSGSSVHLLYAHPGHRVAPSAGKLGAGLDVRGDGSYIVLAPTLHPRTGLPYTWPAQDWREALTPWPAAVDELLRPAPPKPRTSSRPVNLGGRPAAVGRVAGLLEFVLDSTDGNRNARLHWAACRFGEMVAEGIVEHGAAVDALFTAGRTIGLDAAELVGAGGNGGTILSGLRQGQRTAVAA